LAGAGPATLAGPGVLAALGASSARTIMLRGISTMAVVPP
jgi:hypothetical protein